MAEASVWGLQDALSVLEDMRRHGLEAEVATYNQLIASCSKSSPAAAADVYQRMVAAGTQPNSKTFTALIGAFSKCGPIEQALDVIQVGFLSCIKGSLFGFQQGDVELKIEGLNQKIGEGIRV